MGREMQKINYSRAQRTMSLSPYTLSSVDSEQNGDTARDGLQDLDPPTWSETKPGVGPTKKTGRPLFLLFRGTCLHFSPSPVLLSCMPLTVEVGLKSTMGSTLLIIEEGNVLHSVCSLLFLPSSQCPPWSLYPRCKPSQGGQ